MGGVLPVTAMIAIRKTNQIATGIGKLYALETLGSTLGGLSAGFILLGIAGQQSTLIIAVIINILTALYLNFAGKIKLFAIVNK